mgnify:CR=1 FL=1
MRKVAVTGGAGFVGTNLVSALIRCGYQVSVIDDFSTGLRSNVEKLGCEICEVSIVNKNDMYEVLAESEFIFHLAARGSVPRSIANPEATFEVNTRGTFNVLSFAKDFHVPLLFSSSSSVYGANDALPKNEYMWTSPLTPYAASKLYGEALMQSYSMSYNLPLITFRFFNIFGPWQRPDHDYAAVIPKAMNGETILVYGDGEQTRDFTYVDSVVSALINVMENQVSDPQPINLAFGGKISLNQVLNELSGYFPNLRVEYRPERPGDVRNSQNDPSRLFEYFPNLKATQFDVGMRKTIEWFTEHGASIVGAPAPKD